MAIQDKITRFIESEVKESHIIEAAHRNSMLLQKLSEAHHLYKPSVVVKAGVGSGAVIDWLFENTKSFIVVAEPSLAAIQNFMRSRPAKKIQSRVRFINGTFDEFPVDYYKADMLICTDYLDFLNSSRALDEFKRALQFEAVLFFAGVVLADDDIDGVYDDFMRALNPVHQDYYLADDLKTFLELKEFSYLFGERSVSRLDLNAQTAYLSRLFPDHDTAGAQKILTDSNEIFTQLYHLDAEKVIDEHYLTACFMKNKLKD